MKVEKELSGIVTSVKFTNPHGSLALPVRNQDGSSTDWVMTLGTITALTQCGISPLDFLKTVILPHGRVIRISAGNPNDSNKEEESSWLFYERSLGQVSRSQSP